MFTVKTVTLNTKYVRILTVGVVTAGMLWLFSKTQIAKNLKSRVKWKPEWRKSQIWQKTILPTVITGPSGVGKGTLLKRLKEEFKSFDVAVSHTTRACRPGERNGKSYNFVTRDVFETMIKNNAFIEHAEFGGNMYGTSVKAVQDVAMNGKICLLEIDVQGAKSIKELGIEAKFIFITTSGDKLSVLKQRLYKRGSESKESVDKRLTTSEKELKFLDENQEFFDFILKNDDLEEAYNELKLKLKSWYKL